MKNNLEHHITENSINGRCKSCANKGSNNPNFDNDILKGENNPNWIDGRSYKKYPSEFNRKLREEIRARDNYECQGENCGMTEEEHLIVFGQVLHVHHIDYNRKNLNKRNLVSTCKQCNIRANYNRHYWQDYYNQRLVNKI